MDIDMPIEWTCVKCKKRWTIAPVSKEWLLHKAFSAIGDFDKVAKLCGKCVHEK